MKLGLFAVNVGAGAAPTRGSVPIVIGGRSARSARRAVQIGDGYFPSITEPDQLRPLMDILYAEAERLHRDPAEIEVTVPYPGDTADLDQITTQIQRFAQEGVSRTLLPALPEATLRPLLTHLAERIDLG